MSTNHGLPKTVRWHKYFSPCGTLLLGAFDERLCLCDWECEGRARRTLLRLCRSLDAAEEEAETPLAMQAALQLDEYFSGERKAFDIPLLTAGSDFRQAVWQTLQSIGYGQTVEYGELAALSGHPRAVRAVANACAANALSLFIPCHRVVGAKGKPGGYAGGLAAKQLLLETESFYALKR